MRRKLFAKYLVSSPKPHPRAEQTWANTSEIEKNVKEMIQQSNAFGWRIKEL